MSKFFDDIEEEKKEIKKKIYSESTPKNTQKLSKKEKLFLELQTRVFDLEDDNSKKSEKNIKKFLSDLKKYENSYDELPKFLEEFLKSEKVYVKGNVKVVDAFLAKYEENDEIFENLEEIKVEKVTEKDYKKEFDLIKDISDKKIKKDKLLEFSKNVKDEELKIKALIILLTMCARNNEANDLFDILMSLSEYLDNEKVKTILENNIDFYLDILSSVELSSYRDILIKMKVINPDVCERKILEIEFFTNKKVVKTNYVDFELLTTIYEKDLEKSTKIFRSIIPEISSDLTGEIKKIIGPFQEVSNVKIIEDKVFLRIMKEFAHFAFTNQMYEESLICFLYISKKGESSIFLDLLCVILNKKIEETELFKNFILRFREFSNNPLVLPSHEPTSEIFRAFYHLHNCDVESCYNIINLFDKSWDDKNILIESAKSILYK